MAITKTEIIEAGAEAIHESQCSIPDEVCNPDCFRVKELAEAALEAMLPLVKQSLADSVRYAHIKDSWPQEQDAYEYEEWFYVGIEYATKLIRDFEL